jgi:OOP family OmpA-OmpF porin
MFGIFAFLLWSGGSGYWYACKIKGVCGTDSAPSGTMASAASPSDSVPMADSLEKTPPDAEIDSGEIFPEEIAPEEIAETVIEPPEEIPAVPEKTTLRKAPSSLPGSLKNKRTVLFSYAKPIINGRPDLSDYLREAAAYLISNPTSKASLVGYTDDTAARENNLKLGMKRAEALAGLLREEGVPDSQIVLESKGESDPIGDNNTRDGRQQNRRVEMQLLDQ